ncbi:MAG: 4Fe-4S binding protein [Fusobacteria bacterium]|nr:4Fe-4S binding protein [Fusobacteriota bacterium]
MSRLNEIVVISGKGGTGKTTLTASIIPYLGNCVIADCDVDAPDLDILFEKKLISHKEFSGSNKAYINNETCIKCNKCIENCKFNAISDNYIINEMRCEGCTVCEYICPVDAISMYKAKTGELYISETVYGEIVHAKLNPGEETSGRLISEVRKKSKEIAKNNSINNIIIDGAPGVACNVISSITGVTKVIIVTEPTMSGIHDLKRVYELTSKFRLEVEVVINKYDLSIEKSTEIEKYCMENKIKLELKIAFNENIVKAITKKQIPSIYLKNWFMELGFDKWCDSLVNK